MICRTLSVQEISAWLQETDPIKLKRLYDAADLMRKEKVGDAVWLRGLIEASSYCRRNCLYCGIRASRKIERYRLTEQEILECAELAAKLELGSIVIQTGEDLAFDARTIANIIGAIKRRFQLAIVLSLGERSEDEWKRWKDAGADRYLLRFETSNPNLYRAIHPQPEGRCKPDRIEQLKRLREIGYEIGGGVMIGIPGQTYDDLARDLELFRELDLDMIGCGPYLSHPHTPLGRIEARDGRWHTRQIPSDAPENEQEFNLPSNIPFDYPVVAEQVPSNVEMAFKVVALTRILCPQANIPSVTAVATLDPREGRKGALQRGANVIMPNITDWKYREKYEIYPNKTAAKEEAQEVLNKIVGRLEEIGRFLGKGPGTSLRFQNATRL